MKRHIAITLVFMIFAMLFSGCGSTRINYNLYEDAIANFKNQSQMQIKITQDITSIISGGSSTTTSSVSIDAVDLNNAPIYQAKGSIYAIGAYIQYSVYSEKEYCYLSLDQKKTKVECTLGELLQKHAGIRFDVIDLDALLAMSEEDLKETTLQTKEKVHYLSTTIDWKEKGYSDAIVSFMIDQNRCLIGIVIETGVDATYANQEANIDFKWEILFTQPEEPLVVQAPSNLDAYIQQEDPA